VTSERPARPDVWTAARFRHTAACAALAAAYFVAGILGLQLAMLNDSATSVWPASGIAAGVLLRYGPALWPGVAVGAFLVNVSTTGGVLPSLLIASGNTMEALAAQWLVSRFAAGTAAFARAATVFRFALLAGGLAPIVAASTGLAALLTSGLATRDQAADIWFTWWLGDAAGLVTVAPVIVMFSGRRRLPWNAARALETAGAVAAVILASWVVFGGSFAGARRMPLAFVVLPILLWPAFRLGPITAVLTTILMAIGATPGTMSNYGPFARDSPHESLLFVAAFLAVCAMVVLAVSVEVENRERVEGDMRRLNETLEQRVAARTGDLSRMRDRLIEAQRVANVGSWEWDVGTDTIWWSDELFRIYRLPKTDRLRYDQYLSMQHPDDRARVQSAVGKALADRRPFTFEHRILWPDGSVRTLKADGQVLSDEQGELVRLVGTATDVTDRLRAEDERMQRLREQAARIEAEEANQAKDEFLATLSHELRTPLNAALGWAQLLQTTAHDPEARARAIDAIMRNLQAQARLVSDMMDVSHITLRTLRLEMAPVSMDEVVRVVVENVRSAAGGRGVGIETELPDAPAHVMGDAGRLEQVVWNLLSNAAKFTRQDGLVRVALRREGDHIVVLVHDEGPGIEPAFLPHLFERFRQADSSVTRSHGGLGLGLAIARHLVEAHGGTISAANRSEGGAVFTVSLPAAPSPADGALLP
jgi:signal transduction histidine kinase/integral membrane sensor domain MASE1